MDVLGQRLPRGALADLTTPAQQEHEPTLDQLPSTGRPLLVATAIPERASGRQPIFFFGTLLDDDVLATVLGRVPAAASLVPAELEGFRREAAQGLAYPLLVPDAAASVEGRLLLSATPGDIRRINHYESGEYQAALHEVRLPDGRTTPAWLYHAFEAVLQPSGEPWDLGAWTVLHKQGFLRACARWMQGCPRDPAAASRRGG